MAKPSVADNLADVRRRVARACERSRRDPREVTILGVTKKIPVEKIRLALDAGLHHLGENYVQEAVPKMKKLADRAPTWHLIGHLQRNKARRAADVFDRIETVDSLDLAQTLEAEAEEIGRELRVFVQANVGGERTKHGVSIDDVPGLVSEIDGLPRVAVVGLMSVPPPRKDPEDSRADFRELKEAFDALRHRHSDVRHLSMGMSHDFEVAVEEGATEVRVGTAIFGPR